LKKDRKKTFLTGNETNKHTLLGEGSVSPTRRSRNQGGSPKRRGNKTEAEISSPNNGKITDPKLGPIRKTAGVRNLPKIERKNGIGSSGSEDLGGPPPLLPTSSLGPKKSSGVNFINVLRAAYGHYIYDDLTGTLYRAHSIKVAHNF